jgi:nicotinamide-nucleotide amidase
MADQRTERIAEVAKDRELQVGVAESLTCGLLATTIGAAPEAESWFAGGVVAYRTEVKETVLGMTPGIDTCSAQCAEEIARGVRGLLDVDVAVSTTGVGGPDPQDGHAPGTVYLGWVTADAAGHRYFEFDGSPKEVLDQTVDAAVALLEELVEG